VYSLILGTSSFGTSTTGFSGSPLPGGFFAGAGGALPFAAPAGFFFSSSILFNSSIFLSSSL
jgi:hypothetical protein